MGSAGDDALANQRFQHLCIDALSVQELITRRTGLPLRVVSELRSWTRALAKES